jgi:uncharacterized protein
MTFHLLAKPTGARCNLNCAYCFFLSKEELYPESQFRMTDEVLERYITSLFEAQPGKDVQIAWQGGEPTLMGIEFYERAVAIAKRLRAPGQSVTHSFQTNGVLINDDWAEFLKRNEFLVGLSIDGPEPMHDAYRVNKGGAGTFQQVLRAWNLLARYEVDTNILCTIHAANADYPLEVYRYFRDQLGARYLQFIPIVERLSAADQDLGDDRPLVTDRSVRPEQFGTFLTTIFDEWVRHDVGTVFVQSFDAALASWLGQPSLCIFQPTCGRALALEHNGDVYSCDHFVDPQHLLGNILDDDLSAIVDSEKQRGFGNAKFDALPSECRNCDVLFACYGECPRNRFVKSRDGERNHNYLCAGYKTFFRHIDKPMRVMAQLLRDGRYADEIMGILSDGIDDRQGTSGGQRAVLSEPS